MQSFNSSSSSYEANSDRLEEFRRRLMTLLSPYRGKVGYGNLRHEEREWEGENGRVISFVLVYETPGGSTNQITVTYSEDKGFALLNGDPPEESYFSSPEEVLKVIEEMVKQIPQQRSERLKATVEQWVASGKSLHELLQEINRLVRSEFKGGSITHQELKMAIQYCIQLSSGMRE